MTIQKWAHPDTLDGGLASLKNNTNRIVLISAYAKGDSYATVMGNKLAEAAMTPADFVLSTVGDGNRRVTSAAKSSTATATVVGADLGFAWVDTASQRVLYVTDESTDMPVTSGNGINFPALSYTSNQPQ